MRGGRLTFVARMGEGVYISIYGTRSTVKREIFYGENNRGPTQVLNHSP